MTMLNTAVSGMLAQNNWLATIAQNIANSSTTGYKNAETDFSALVDQVASTSGSPGLGVVTSQRTLSSHQGGILGTTTPTDLAVQGNGFFVVSDAAGDTFLTRDGSFVPDKNGDLVNAAGYYLMGANVQNGGSGAVGSVSTLQKVNINQTGLVATATTTGSLAVNLPSAAAIVPAASTPAGGGSTTTAETSLLVYDSSGSPVTLNIYATRVADNPTGTPTWEIDVYNSANAAAGGGFPYSGPALASQTINFDPTTGQTSGASTLSIQVPGGQVMSLDMSASTQVAAGFFVNAATANGSAPTAMTSVTFSPTGAMSFNYANGTSLPGYVIPLANVDGSNYLTPKSGTVFSVNANSGPMVLGTPGSNGLGTLRSSALESSTVDIATELTSMIQAQSDYGFNSQVFQTGSTLEGSLKDL
jgi:flagellar hook protein FlgE